MSSNVACRSWCSPNQLFHCKSGIIGQRRAGSRGSVAPVQTRRRVTTLTDARIRTKTARIYTVYPHSHRSYNEGCAAHTHIGSAVAGAQLRPLAGEPSHRVVLSGPRRLPSRTTCWICKQLNPCVFFSTYPRWFPNLSTCDAYSSLPFCLVFLYVLIILRTTCRAVVTFEIFNCCWLLVSVLTVEYLLRCLYLSI